MNSDAEEFLDYTSASDNDIEEDVDENDSKQEGKGKKKPIAWKKWCWKLDPRSTMVSRLMVPNFLCHFTATKMSLIIFYTFSHRILSKPLYYLQPIPMDKNLEVTSKI